MKRMCLIIVTALIIIICVIAFKSFTEEKEESFDGILIEKNISKEYDNGILFREEIKNNWLKRELDCLLEKDGCILWKEKVRNGEML